MVGAGCLPGISEGVVPESDHAWWDVLDASGVEAPVPERDGGVFVVVSVGESHGCGLRADGSVHCWGDNFSGAASPPEGVFTMIDAGYGSTCGVLVSGAGRCWGHLESPPSEFVTLGVGMANICGVLLGGQELECWGPQTYGTDEAIDHTDGEFVSVKAGASSMCAQRSNGELECWGDNTVYVFEGDLVESSSRHCCQSVAPEGVFVDYSVGFQHACGLRPDGRVECWGDDGYGQSSPPEGVFVSVSAGGKVSCGLRLGGQVECWGGRRTKGRERVAAPSPAGIFVAVDAGGLVVCGVDVRGAIECWDSSPAGDSDYMPAGWLMSLTTARAPAGEFVALAADGDFTCALGVGDDLACWGQDFHGQSSPPPGRYTAVTVGYQFGCALVHEMSSAVCWGNLRRVGEPPEGSFTDITAGRYHACGLRGRGVAECWGLEDFGIEDFTTPPPESFTAISAGDFHTCGLRPDGTVRCWGISTRNDQPTPSGNFTQLASEGFRTCGLRPNGTAECWYYKNFDSMDYPDDDGADLSEIQARYDPPDVPFKELTIGRWHACGIRSDNTVQCWPKEAAHYLIEPTKWFIYPTDYVDEWSDSRAEPLPGEFTTLAAGKHHTCGIRPDKTIDCWSGLEPRNPPPPTTDLLRSEGVAKK